MKRCCVVITYYEAGDALRRSLDSLDSVDSITVVVVDDGSTRVPASTILADYSTSLEVHLVELSSNAGVEHAANAGLRVAADYEFVARLDCGDVCVADRFATQMAYLDSQPECALVGSWVTFTDLDGRDLYTVRHPVKHQDIRRQMFVNCAITQPSVMFRSSVLDRVDGYPTDKPAAEDFAFFMKVMEEFRVANIPRVLVRCIVDPAGISTVRRRRQIMSRVAILLEHFEATPIAVYGILRGLIQSLTPRATTVRTRTFGQTLIRRPIRRSDVVPRVDEHG